MDKPKPTTIGTIRLLIGALARHDGEAAMRWMNEHLNRSAMWDACWRDAGRAWAMKDPKGFVEWYRAGKAAEYRDHFSFSPYVASWLAAKDVRFAAEFVCQEKGLSVSGRDDFADQIATPADVAGVRAVLDRFPPKPPKKTSDGHTSFDGSSSRNLQRSLEKAWPAADPAGWKAYLTTHPVGAYGEDLWLNERVKGMVGAGNRAEAGEAILGQIPPDGDRQAAVLAIVRAWSADDPQAAVNWAAGKVDAAGREKLVTTVAGALLKTDPPAAVDLWLQLPESPRRNDRVAATFDRWHEKDPAAAEAYRAKAGWSEEITRAIRERLLTRPAGRGSSALDD